MTPKKQVSPAIRILRGERDASARATHLEAATRKFLVTTNERKQMSTKTNFKRIALVAVAALGLGVLSSVPSQAVVSGLTVTVTDGTAPLSTVTMLGSAADSRTSAKINITGTIDALDSITIRLVEVSQPASGDSKMHMYYHDSATSTQTGVVVETLTAANSTPALHGVAGAALTQAVATPAAIGTTVASENGAGMVRIATASGAATKFLNLNIGVQLDSATGTRRAGTYAYRAIVETWHAGLQQAAITTAQYPINIVIAAAATSSATATATYAFANLSETTIADGASSTADASLNVSATGGSVRGYLFVAVRNAANGSATATDSLTATVTGAGLVCSEAGTCGKSLSKIAVTGDYQFTLQGDGTGGASTVTVTSGVTGASYVKQLTYYASAAKTLTATAFTPNLLIGTNDSAVSVVATDAAGTTWGGTAYIYASTAADATAVGGSATTPVACSFLASKSIHYCPITTTAVGTGKFKVIDASTVALATATSAEVTVTSKLSIPSNVKVAFNKSTYAPYEKAYITVTPVDAAGGKLPGGTYTNLLASGGVTSSTAFHTGSAASGSAAGELGHVSPVVDAYAGTDKTGGDETYVVYMPASGTVTITWTGGSSLPLSAQVKGTASASVTDPGTAALAAVTALATTVASLKTLITTLTNLVLKIQKKVKA